MKLLRNCSLTRLWFPITFLPSDFLSETRVMEFYLLIVLTVSNFQRETKKKLEKEGNQSLICSKKCKGVFF